MLGTVGQDLFFWRLVYELVIHQGYRVLNFNENGEIWLESSERKNRKMVRLLRYDIDWGNWILRDIANLSKTTNALKKQLNRKKLDIYNVYISTYPPVDEWEHQLKSNDSLDTILIDLGNREERLEKLFEKLHLPLPDLKTWITNETDPNSLIHSIRKTEQLRNQQEKKLLFAKKPFLTYGIVAVNIVMYLLLEWFGSSTDILTLIKFGAKYNAAILEGEWWRFITPLFLHIGFLHLFMNTMALYYLGLSVERIYGSWRFLIIYLLAGIAGAIASFAFTTQISAGASGAIFGCFGALLYFGVVYPTLFLRTMGTNIFIVLAINLGFGFLVPMIDNSAHIGGLIGGFLAAAFVHLPNHKMIFRQLGAFAFLGISIFSVLLYGYQYSAQSEDPMITIQISQQYIEQGEYQKANQLLAKFVENDPEASPEMYFLLSYTEIQLGHLSEAVPLLEHVVNEKPNFHEAYYNLALLYIDLGEYAKAKAAVEEALKIKPKDSDYQSLLAKIDKIK